MFSNKIDSNEAGQRFDKYLKKLLKNAPDSFLYKMLRKKNITLNSKKADGKEILKLEDEVKIFFSDETFEKFSGFKPEAIDDSEEKKQEEQNDISAAISEFKQAYEQLQGIRIVYEDEDVLILNKPSGILTQKAAIADLTLNEWMIGYLFHTGKMTSEILRTFKPSICNRLDRNTSGMVICGKTLAGIQQMNQIIKDRSLHKYYLCVVYGTFKQKEGHLEGYLYKKQAHNTVEIFSSLEDVPAEWKDKAAYINTRFQVLESNQMISLLKVELITGKTHQIRAHLSSIGHPLIGDGKYGNKQTVRVSKEYKIKGQMLHAWQLEFPQIEEKFTNLSEQIITCNPPEIFYKLFPDYKF